MRIKKAQTFIEYILVISIVTAILIAMSTMLRRTVQGMVKAVADQVGFQQNAEQQKGSATGYVGDIKIYSQKDQQKQVRDRLGNITYSYDTYYTKTQKEVFTSSTE